MIDRVFENRYKITEKIGESAMSEVFRAHDLQETRDVVMKFLRCDVHAQRVEDIIRFQRDLNAVMRMDHPGIVKVYGVRQEENRWYIIMESLKGKTLAQWRREGRRFSVAEGMSVGRQIAEALVYVHERRVIHRDIKADNIMLSEDGHVTLLDFGLAQFMEYTEIARDEVSGTFSYMSPEQAGIVRKPVDDRSDLYSLGVVLYELLTAELPFQGDDVTSLLYQQVACTPGSLRQHNPLVPDILERIVLKLLNKEPEERYQTARGLLADILRYEGGQTSFVVGKEDRLVRLSYRTRLIGRDVEMKIMTSLLGEAVQGRGAVCLVSSDAGGGKTRLVDEFRSIVHECGGIMVGGKCLSQDTKIPYLPFINALNEYVVQAMRQRHHILEATVGRLKEILGPLGDVLVQLNPALRNMLGEFPPLVPLDPERENRRFLAVVSRFICGLGEKSKPCVIFLEDMHWADVGTLSLLAEIAEDVHGASVLIVVTFRDSEVDSASALRRIQERVFAKQHRIFHIHLGAFTLTQLNRFVAELLLDDEDYVSRLSEFIMTKSHGNPFFSSEIIRQLVDAKVLTHRDDDRHWQINWQKIGEIPISATIVDMVLRRIDVMEGESVDLLSSAAVIGREFDLSLLFSVSSLSKERILSIVDDAIMMQLLEKSAVKGKVSFVHDRIRDAFCERLTDARKRALHLVIARTIEKENQDNINSVLYVLAYHYIEAGDDDKVLVYALPAAQQAKQRYASMEAIQYFTKVIDILSRRRQGRSALSLQAKEGLIESFNIVGRYTDAICLSQQIFPLIKERIGKARLYRLVSGAYFKLGDWKTSQDSMRKSLALLGERLPRTRIGYFVALCREMFVQAAHRLAPFLWTRFDFRPPRQQYLEIVQCYPNLIYTYLLSNVSALMLAFCYVRLLNVVEAKIGRSAALATGYRSVAGGCMASGLFETARAYLENSVKVYREYNDSAGLASAMQEYGYLYQWWGRYDESLHHFREANALIALTGDMWEEGMIVQGMGITYFNQGNYPCAIEWFQKYADISQRTKDAYGMSSSQAWLALVYAQLGDLNEAQHAVQKSLAISKEKQVWFILCFGLANAGFIFLEAGDVSKAIESLEQARSLNEKYSFLAEYTVHLYVYLAEAYLEQIRDSQDTFFIRMRLRQVRRLAVKTLRRTRRWSTHLPGAYRVNALYQAYLRERNRAEKYFHKSISVAEETGRRYELGRSCFEFGRSLERWGRHGEARHYMQRSHDLFSEIGASLCLRRVSAILGSDRETRTSVSTTKQQQLRIDEELKGLIRASQYISALVKLEELLGRIMETAMEVVGAERGFLLLSQSIAQGKSRTHDDQEELVAVVSNISGKQLGAGAVFDGSRSVVDAVVKDRQPRVIVDAGVDMHWRERASVVRNNLRSILCVPLITKNNQMLGIIYLDSRLVSGLFSVNDLTLLQTFAVQAAISIENAILVRQEKEMERQIFLAEERARYADILREKNMALAAEKSKMNTMVEKMSEGIIMFGENDQLVILNAIARDLLGCSGTVDQSMLLYCLREIKLLESLDEIRNAYPASWMKEVRVDNTYTRVIRAEGLQILDETQRPLGIVIIMRDVTRERQTDQLKNDFIAMVSHELRTPLVAVKAATATLLGQSAGQMNERQQHLLAIAKNNMQRLEKLIDALLDVAKIEAGQMAVFGQPTDIVGLIDDTVHIFEASARERHVRLFWDPPSGIPPIVIDGDKITQVVSNLLGNAVKFTPPGGCITVTVSYENSMIRVKVADTGLGIPQADLGKIFDKFYQVTRKTDERVGSGGTGLGLTICKAIVEKHGGSIWVESKVGKGSTFCFTLPARLEGST